MEKQITFRDADKDLIQEILHFQKEHEIKYFVETVRQLCRQGLKQNVNVKIDIN
ncbi:MAG: hypothetical protein IJ011_02695 [Clostridia bacterium]|nr:hypothetical protein [Clostridia bacterium]